jgi:hypothetical protein
VLAAPYHRLPGAIILAQRAMAAKPAAAHDILLNTGADYVVVCGSRMRPDFTAAEQTESLWAEVKVGLVPDWLEPIAETQKGPLLAFRIKR